MEQNQPESAGQPPERITIEDASMAQPISESAEPIADFAATAKVVAESLGITAMPLEPFWLSPSQRGELLAIPDISKDIRAKLLREKELSGTVADAISITMMVAEVLNEGDAERKLALLSVAQLLVNQIEEDIAAVAGSRPKQAKKPHTTADPGTIFQFRITLLGIEPPIWRRIQIPDCTLAGLHAYIQAAFGWERYHLHVFEIDGTLYSKPAPDGNDCGLNLKNDTKVRLSGLIPKSGRRTQWIYEYDVRDSWRHTVLFEGFPPSDPKTEYPLCLEGERACPPENCGGPEGYADYVPAIADPTHEQHEEMLGWYGPFDPEAFDAERATIAMQKLMR